MTATWTRKSMAPFRADLQADLDARKAALGRFAATERFPTLEAYWRDPAPFEAERAVEQAKVNASQTVDWDAHWRRHETNDALEAMTLELLA